MQLLLSGKIQLVHNLARYVEDPHIENFVDIWEQSKLDDIVGIAN